MLRMLFCKKCDYNTHHVVSNGQVKCTVCIKYFLNFLIVAALIFWFFFSGCSSFEPQTSSITYKVYNDSSKTCTVKYTSPDGYISQHIFNDSIWQYTNDFQSGDSIQFIAQSLERNNSFIMAILSDNELLQAKSNTDFIKDDTISVIVP